MSEAEVGQVDRRLANLRPAWEPGKSANPGGKPVAARNKINARFLNALLADFDEGGVQAIRRCREEDPSAYVRALMALQPKEVELVKSPFSELSDEQLESIFAACGAILSAQSGSAGNEGEAGAEQAEALQPLPQTG